MKFLKFRWLDNLSTGLGFKPDLEVGVEVEGFRVPGLEGERTGGRFEVYLEGMIGEAVEGLYFQGPDDSRAVFEGPRRRFDALECAVSLL